MKRFAIIPAAGIGTRMQSVTPKQYLKLNNGLSILDTTISQLLQTPFFDLLIIAVNKNDTYWKNSIHLKNQKIRLCYGGNTRSDSVRNALVALKETAENSDWIFVHDAARPCIHLNDIRRLYAAVITEKAIGGILACQATDTVKQGDMKQRVIKTFDRSSIYLAQTPQVFRYQPLLMAYYFCLENKINVTDEASAIEALDHQPLIVKGNAKNIKITKPEDLVMANYFLSLLS